MTIETEDYSTRQLMEQGKQIRNNNGWTSLHTDFINNDESQGYHVTFVNGIDDPDNSPDAISRREAFLRKKELNQKLNDDTISFNDLKELLRLSNL